jgi:hypothetical protein
MLPAVMQAGGGVAMVPGMSDARPAEIRGLPKAT